MATTLNAQDAIPNCVPSNRLKPGDAFNPYKAYFAPSINTVVMTCSLMSLATKAVWIFLAHEVYEDGWTELGERQMARLLHIPRFSLVRHLTKLRKLGLLRLHHQPGKVAGRQLVYQEMFRICRPNLGGPKIESTPGPKIRSTEDLKLGPHLCINDLRDYSGTIQDVGDQLPHNGVASHIPPARLNQTERTGFSAITSPKQNHPYSKDHKKPAPQPSESTVKGTSRHLQHVPLNSLLQLFEPTQNQRKPKAHTHAIDHTGGKEKTKTTDATPNPPKPKTPIP